MWAVSPRCVLVCLFVVLNCDDAPGWVVVGVCAGGIRGQGVPGEWRAPGGGVEPGFLDVSE